MNEDAAVSDSLPTPPPIAALFASGATLLLGIVALVFGSTAGATAGWVAAVAMGLVGFGAISGVRPFVTAGVLVLGAASLVATYEASLAKNLSVNSAVAVIAMAVVVAVDLSYSTRRKTVVSRTVVTSVARTYAVITAIGVAAAVAVLAVALSVSWPGWLLVLPAAVLAGVAIAMLVVLVRAQRSGRIAAANERTGSGGNDSSAISGTR